MKNKTLLVLVLVAIAAFAIFGTAYAAWIWTENNTTVVRSDLALGSTVFEVYGYNAEASFGGTALWYKDCDEAAGVDGEPRVHIKRKSTGEVQVICIDVEIEYP